MGQSWLQDFSVLFLDLVLKVHRDTEIIRDFL